MTDRAIRRMLAFVEFAQRGDPDLTYAIDLARQLGAELILFGVIDTPAMVALIGRHRAAAGRGEGVALGETLTAAMVADAKQILQGIVDRAAAQGVSARGHATVSEEVPEQILQEAIVQHVDLIVIQPTAEKGFLQKFLGSTVAEVLDAAPCAVLVAQRGS
ncbi:MAG: universal stress protein [Planctomycetes bacterium]|nr:universal stress protein [Planctomycetota bacterium]